MIFEATEHCGNVYVWFGICCDEDCNGTIDWFAVQTSNDGFASG
jgi:benzoyl-CoA reductase/2-hydroxyglutaryl-CoA dehydratase subunit BcrC/BadD/HgdB